mmetsp:Transcript_7849/g.19584  ORF Transcript_7849/g.19584 Transcript_7849/m.19584 type:complete len:923 (-) Transcript_7849:2348-5116(-)
MAGLDDLDLDDMFNDDGDNLFDGLDIELDGTMGDIISNEKNDVAAPIVAPPPPPKPKRTGPRTMRTNPMLEKAEKEAEAAGGGTSKRRKTKRKTKAPTPFGDEEDVDTQAALIEMHQPKKKRKAALRAKKATEELALGNQAKSSTDALPAAANVGTTKRKKKGSAAGASATANASTGIPSFTGGHVAPGTSSSVNKRKLPTVAAAGRFGAGVLKRGSSAGPGVGTTTTTKVKRKLKKTASGSAGDGMASAPPPGVPTNQPRIPVPKQESMNCGLARSRVLFYPFLDGVPSQATLQKRKAYPMLDKVSSTLTSTIANSSSSSSTSANAAIAANGPESGNSMTNGLNNHKLTENSAVFKLMLETYGGISDKEKAGSEEKRAALLAGMPKLRKAIDGLDKTRLVADVYHVCWLLGRQYTLMKRSLENMEHWCKDNFTEEDYSATYEEELEKVKLKLRKWPSAVCKVKIVLPGFREPKGASQLEAELPSYVVAPPTTGASNKAAVVPTAQKIAPGDSASATPTKTKKRKSVVGSTATKSATAEKAKEETFVPYPSLTPKVPKGPTTYADSSPETRRNLIMDRVAHLTMDLEQVARQAPAGSAAQSAANKSLANIPSEDPPLHTARMWEWLQSAGFYRPLDQLALRRLTLHRAPEVHPRGFFLAPATKIQSSDEFKKLAKSSTNVDEASKTETSQVKQEDSEVKVSPESLFDRLQALLVEESSEASGTNGESTMANSTAVSKKSSDELYDLDDEDDSDDEVESFGFLNDDDDNEDDANNIPDQTTSTSTGSAEKKIPPPVADISRLCLEERTFVHLSSAGLIQKSIFPSVKLAKSTKKTLDGKDYEGDDLVGVVGAMAVDLSKTTALNNSRISFLQATAAGSDLISNKQVEEEQAAVITRCQNMLKRSKEKAKKAKAKKADSLNLPW